MKWVSVEEKLPEDRQRVLTYLAELQQILLHTYYEWDTVEASWWIGEHFFALKHGRITHWMPLPEKPYIPIVEKET